MTAIAVPVATLSQLASTTPSVLPPQPGAPAPVASPQPIVAAGTIVGAPPSTLHEALMGAAALGGDTQVATDIAPDIAGINAPVDPATATTTAALVAAGHATPAGAAAGAASGAAATGSGAAPTTSGGGLVQAGAGAQLAGSDQLVAQLTALLDTMTKLIAALRAPTGATDASATDSTVDGGGEVAAAEHACGMAGCAHDHAIGDPAHRADAPAG